MTTRTKDLKPFTSDELLTEVLDRSAGDRPALDRISETTIRAVLNDCDEKAEPETESAAPTGHDDKAL